MKKRFLRRASALLLALTLTLTLLPLPASAANTIVLSKSSNFVTVILEKGDKDDCFYLGDADPNVPPQWESNDEDVAKINVDESDSRRAYIEGVGAGRAVITLSYQTTDGKTVKQIHYAIVEAPIEKVALKDPPSTLVEGETVDLEVEINPSDATNQNLIWTSSNAAITVDENGKVTAEAVGEAVITVTSEENSDCYDLCYITVIPPILVTGITLDETSLELVVGDTAEIQATVTPDDATNKEVRWSSSDDRIAAVDKNTGEVTAVGPGTATITARARDGSDVPATCSVKVKAVPVKEVTLDAALSLSVGDTKKLMATVYPEGEGKKVSQSVTWKSSDETIATVDAEGKVTAVSMGKATITATSVADSAKFASCKVTVTASTAPVSGVVLSPGAEVLAVDETVELTATITPEYAANQSLEWTIEDVKGSATVISLAADGRKCTVTGKAPGSAVVKVTSKDGAKTAICEIEVSGLWISKTSATLVAGESETLEFATYGDAPAYDEIQWESSNPSVAEIDGGRISTYNPGTVTLTATAGKYKHEIKVIVEADEADAIETSVEAGTPLSFADLIDDLDDCSVDRTKSSLSYLTGVSVSTGEGILYYGYVSPDAPGAGVGSESYYVEPGVNQRKLADLSFVPKTGFSGTAVIDYSGRGTEGGSFKGTIRVKVEGSGDVTYGTAAGRAVTFETEDFTAVCKAKTGREIEYLTFTPPASSKGTLYYNYTPTGQYAPEVSSATKYYRTNNPYISNISFVPAEGYTGTVEIPYRCTTSGGTRSGTVTINVYDPDGEGEGHVEYSVAQGGHVDLVASDFNDACQEMLDANLNYVYFDLPDEDEGILYYNYSTSSNYGSRVLSTTRYFRGSSPRISYITFVPDSGFSGTVDIPFTAYDSTGDSFEGELVIRVGGSDGTVYYTSSFGQPVEFDGLDFNEACQSVNSASLDWISFEQPRSSVGALYRNYRSSSSKGSKVSESSTFTRSTISDVTFVPDDDFSGTATVYFSGEDTGGARFSGEVKITVGEDAGDEVVRYTTVSGGLVNFDAGDFNDACQAITDANLRYVRFELPPSREGKLYYNYNSSRDSGTSVSSSTSYYRTGGSRSLDNVSFLAASTLTGTAVIEYTGWTTGGKKFTGTVEVSVGSSAPQSSAINYTGSSLPITLWDVDFQAACSAALGGTLSYIRFDTLPAESVGGLYLGYQSPIKPGVAVTTNTTITPNGTTGAGQLTFLPKAEYQGQVNLTYTGWDTQGRSYNGTVGIDLSNYHCTTAFADLGGYEWAKPSIEFLRQAGITTGYSATSFGPGRQINRGEFALMVCRAFQLNTGGTSSFPDVPADSVYAWAVATAKDLGIAQGNNGLFNPTSPITRQSAMAMIYRAMRAAGIITPTASTNLLSSYADGRQVATHARVPVAALIQMGAVKGNTSMELKPTTAISRAEMAVILHRVLTA